MSHIIRELLKATNLVLRLENVGIFLGTTGRAASRWGRHTPSKYLGRNQSAARFQHLQEDRTRISPAGSIIKVQVLILMLIMK